MKTPSDDLFLLIKSLNKTEKRYFKLYLEKTAADVNIYSRLFDAIDQQKEYNEKVLKQKNLKKAKNNLSQIILKCLDQYYSDTLFESRFKNQFKSIYILYAKGLYAQCSKGIERLKKELLFYERYSDIIELCKLARRLPVKTKKKIEQIYALEKDAMDRLSVEIAHRRLSSEIFETIEITQRARNAEATNRIKRFLKDPLLNNKKQPQAFRSAYFYNDSVSLCYHILGQEGKGFIYRKNQDKLFKKNPHQAEQYPELYINMLNNSLITAYLSGKLKEYHRYLSELKKLEVKYNNAGSNHLAVSVFCASADNEITNLTRSGNFNRITELIFELEDKLKRYSNGISINYKLNLYYIISYNFFGAGDYSKALLWINNIINHPKTETRSDLQVHARILSLLIHYEMKNDDFIGNINRSVHRFLNKKGKLFKYESMVLSFINKIYLIADPKEKINAFKIFRDQLLVLKTDPLERFAFEEFDIISWLESKIENRSFAEIVREKAKQKFAN